ncbi:MAG TPA: PAS domain-containing protein, partial [Kofleriaceae bacterium]
MTADDLWFALFDEAPVFMTFHEGADLRLTHVNRRSREVADLVTLIGRSARELLQGDQRTLAILERVYATGEPATVCEMPPTLAPQLGVHDTRYLTRNFVPIRGVDGTVRGVLHVASDVTGEVRERFAREEIEKRSQVELQRMFVLLDEAPVMFSVVEYPDWRITMANRMNRAMMGDRPHLGLRLRDIVGPDNPTLAALDRAFTSGRSESYELVT